MWLQADGEKASNLANLNIYGQYFCLFKKKGGVFTSPTQFASCLRGFRSAAVKAKTGAQTDLWRNWTAHQILQKQVSLAEKRLQSNRAVGAVGYLDLEREDSGLRRDHMLCKQLHQGDAARAGVVEGREGSKDFVNIISMHLILTWQSFPE